MQIKSKVLGLLANNVYFIEGSKGVVIVDPSCDYFTIMETVGDLPVSEIVITHAHWDHVGVAKALRDATGARVVASAIDAPVIAGDVDYLTDSKFEACPVDVMVEDGQEIELGGHLWKVLVTPGHTPGSMCLFRAGESPDDVPVLISGDTLFRGTHGRTDFKGGSQADMEKSLQRLIQLPDETVVLPGHNEPTTIELERNWIA